jgi:transcriptional antiterminator RfaH
MPQEETGCHGRAAHAGNAFGAPATPVGLGGALPASCAWYVAYTDARQEDTARLNLERQGFDAYLPLYKTRKRVPRKDGSVIRTEVFEPMFPRYMFFRPANERQSISPAHSTRGVSSIVRFGVQFALIQSAVIDAIRQQESLRNALDLSMASTLRPGTRVRVTAQAFEGLEGLIHAVSAQRIVVLMEILGRQARLKVSPDAIEPV